jgi:hypothetical protein
VTDPIKDAIIAGHPQGMGIIGEKPLIPEELAKISPAAALANKVMGSSTSFEDAINQLKNQPGVQVHRQGTPAFDFAVQQDSWYPTAEFPHRPDHPDFRDMARIINDMDTVAESQGWEHVFLPMDVDPASIRYLAQQRVLRAKELLKDATVEERLLIMWIDAFTLGAKLMEERRTIETVLDEAVDTHHRSGGRA